MAAGLGASPTGPLHGAPACVHKLALGFLQGEGSTGEQGTRHRDVRDLAWQSYFLLSAHSGGYTGSSWEGTTGCDSWEAAVPRATLQAGYHRGPGKGGIRVTPQFWA